MDSKLIPTLASLAFVLFVLYLVLASPVSKLNAMCWPVSGAGQVVVATSRMISGESTARGMAKSWDRHFQTCRLWVWNIFYEEQYRALNGQPAMPTPATPASAASKAVEK